MAFYLPLFRLAFICVLFLVVHVQARCLNPAVRREWRKLSKQERTEWVNAVRCLNKLPHDPALKPSVDRSISLIPPVNTSSSFWDDISYVHMDLNHKIHFTGLFLPWHRAYVWGMESALKSKCNYQGVHPYWDWTQDASDFYHATILNDDPESGFGGWGDPTNDYQITTGGFATDFQVSYPVPHGIRRNFTLQPSLGYPDDVNTTFTKSNTDYMVNSFEGDFAGFQAYFESLSGPHPGPHRILGGDMAGDCPGNVSPGSCVPGPIWTPNEPLFFMHHAMVDKLWFDWQHAHESNYYAFFGGTVSEFSDTALFAEYPNGGPPFLNFTSQIPSDGLLWKNLTIWDVMDTTSGPLCYTYSD